MEDDPHCLTCLWMLSPNKDGNNNNNNNPVNSTYCNRASVETFRGKLTKHVPLAGQQTTHL